MGWHCSDLKSDVGVDIVLVLELLDIFTLEVGITYHGHHNYSPDWSTSKGNPARFFCYLGDEIRRLTQKSL